MPPYDAAFIAATPPLYATTLADDDVYLRLMVSLRLMPPLTPAAFRATICCFEIFCRCFSLDAADITPRLMPASIMLSR